MFRLLSATVLSIAGSTLPATTPAQPTSPVDATAVVRAIDLDVTLVPERGLIRSEAALELEGTGATFVDLDLDPQMLVERISGRPGVVEHRHSGSRLRIHLDPPLSGPRTIRVTVTGRPRHGDRDRVTPEFAALDPAGAWYPVPREGLHDLGLTVRVPPGWTAAGPGNGERRGEGVWRFRPDRPVRTVALAAGPDLEITSTRIAGRELTVAAPPSGPDASVLGPAFSDPLSWYSAALAPFPFDGLCVAVVPGLEAPVRGSGFLAFPPDAVPATRGEAAHAVAGQWYGEWLAAEGPWIRAFAAWHARIYAVDRRVAPADAIERARREYLDLAGSRDVPLIDANPDSPEVVLIGKGSAAPEMVRGTIGSRAFASVLSDLMALAPRRIRAADLRAIVGARGGPDGLRAFEDWFERRDVPRLRATLRVIPAAGGGFRADVRIEQAGTPFHLAVPVVLRGVGDEHRETIRTAERRVDVFYILPFRPARLEVDPLDRIFQHAPEIVDP